LRFLLLDSRLSTSPPSHRVLCCLSGPKKRKRGFILCYVILHLFQRHNLSPTQSPPRPSIRNLLSFPSPPHATAPFPLSQSLLLVSKYIYVFFSTPRSSPMLFHNHKLLHIIHIIIHMAHVGGGGQIERCSCCRAVPQWWFARRFGRA
jgi:hypothetical protein